MRSILALLRKDFLLFVRDRTDFAVTFFVPVVLIVIFGFVFGVSRNGRGSNGLGSIAPVGITIAVVAQTNDPLVAKVVEALRLEKSFKIIATEKDAAGHEQPLTETRVRTLIHENKFRFGLIFPPDAASETSFGLKLKFLTNPINDIENNIVSGLLQKTVFTVVPPALFQSLPQRASQTIGQGRSEQFYHTLAQTVADSFGGDPTSIYEQMRSGNFDFATEAAAKSKSSGDQGKDFLSRLVQIDTEQLAGQHVKNPMATRLVGGWAMMFLMFSVSGSATGLFNEKKAGLFLRLLSMPVHRMDILWSKYLYGMALGLIQLTVMFVAGHFLYGIDIVSNFGNLLIACLAASTACTAFGMLLAAVAPSPQAASGLATLIILSMSAIGGAWFPTSLMPDFIQHLSKLTLVYWSIEGFQQVLWEGCTFRELLPTLVILVGMAAVVNVFSIWRFTRGSIFE